MRRLSGRARQESAPTQQSQGHRAPLYAADAVRLAAVLLWSEGRSTEGFVALDARRRDAAWRSVRQFSAVCGKQRLHAPPELGNVTLHDLLHCVQVDGGVAVDQYVPHPRQAAPGNAGMIFM